MRNTTDEPSREPPKINTKDPYVIAAAEKLGISFSDINYPTESDISMYTHNTEFRSYVNLSKIMIKKILQFPKILLIHHKKCHIIPLKKNV